MRDTILNLFDCTPRYRAPRSEWMADPRNMPKIQSGDTVALNPAWVGYNYLKKEYPKLFPAKVAKVLDGVVTLSGIRRLNFATQTLRKA